MVKNLDKPIGLLGGSFDPAHKGHLTISKIAIKKIRLKNVFWVVARKNPFKDQPFYSLSERMLIAKKLASTTKKIKVVYLDKILKSSRSIATINYFVSKKKLKLSLIHI